MIRVFVVSPVPLVRAGLSALVESDPDCQVVASVAPDESTVDQIVASGADIALIDADSVTVEQLSDAVASSNIGAGTIRPLFVAPIAGDIRITDLPADGAWGFISRDAGEDEVLAAVHAVAGGLVVIDPTLVASFVPQAPDKHTNAIVAADGLTARELEVLQLIAAGLPNKSIATQLRISEHTVKFHVSSMLSKLGAASRAEAVREGARRGLLAL